MAVKQKAFMAKSFSEKKVLLSPRLVRKDQTQVCSHTSSRAGEGACPCPGLRGTTMETAWGGKM